MKLGTLVGIGIVVAFLRPGIKISEPTGLKVREEPKRIVMQWNGPTEPPMLQSFEEAFRKVKNDPRRILISLNSPGGSVEHGALVIDEIRKAGLTRSIDTMLEAGKICASMCVPIYLTGMERFAAPGARFMFHEVSFRLKPEAQRKLAELTRSAGISATEVQKLAVNHFTDKLFSDGFEHNLNDRWLTQMRDKIKGRDVWMTGQELVNEGSGVVDKLLRINDSKG